MRLLTSPLIIDRSTLWNWKVLLFQFLRCPTCPFSYCSLDFRLSAMNFNILIELLLFGLRLHIWRLLLPLSKFLDMYDTLTKTFSKWWLERQNGNHQQRKATHFHFYFACDVEWRYPHDSSIIYLLEWRTQYIMNIFTHRSICPFIFNLKKSYLLSKILVFWKWTTESSPIYSFY